MNLDYNIFMEVAVIPLDIVLYCYLMLRYTNMTRINVAFRRFAFLVMLADIIDVSTAKELKEMCLTMPIMSLTSWIQCLLHWRHLLLSITSMLIPMLKS